MTLSKKILAVVMSLVMLVACFAVSATAIYTDGYTSQYTAGQLHLYMTADKTTVNPGDTVTFSVHADMGTLSNLSAFGHVFLYNSKQLAPVGTSATFRQWQGDCANFAKEAATVNLAFPIAQVAPVLTEEEKAYFDKGILCNGTGLSATTRWNPAPGEVYMTFQMTVGADVQPGEEIWFGMHDSAFTRGMSNFAIEGKRQQNTVFNLTDAMIKLTVASAEKNLEVNHVKNQIRFDKNAEGAYAGTFDYRFLASIDKKNFGEIFADEATAIAQIQEMGFVFADNANLTAGFDTAAAEALAMSAESVDGAYVKQTVTYLQRKADSYEFSCMVADNETNDAQNNLDITAYAYVKYDTGDGVKYAFFDAAVASTFNDHFTRNWNQAFDGVACPVA